MKTLFVIAAGLLIASLAYASIFAGSDGASVVSKINTHNAAIASIQQ